MSYTRFRPQRVKDFISDPCAMKAIPCIDYLFINTIQWGYDKVPIEYTGKLQDAILALSKKVPYDERKDFIDIFKKVVYEASLDPDKRDVIKCSFDQFAIFEKDVKYVISILSEIQRKEFSDLMNERFFED